ncbi:MAG: HEAT repeat domain-containing protein, partial [Alphaproteobacteria bacterium]|nr:HEAT repeat domain-containing protein [Alphaproteobacteria bacterium]
MSRHKHLRNALTALALTAAFAAAAFTPILAPQSAMGQTHVGQTQQVEDVKTDTAPHLLSPLKTDDAAARNDAAIKLGEMALSGQSVPVILPALINLTRDTDSAVRHTATQYVGTLGTNHRSHSAAAVRALTLLADDTEPHIRATAAAGLGTIGTTHASAANTALRGLTAVLARHDNTVELRRDTVNHIAAIGTAHPSHAGTA